MQRLEYLALLDLRLACLVFESVFVYLYFTLHVYLYFCIFVCICICIFVYFKELSGVETKVEHLVLPDLSLACRDQPTATKYCFQALLLQ